MQRSELNLHDEKLQVESVNLTTPQPSYTQLCTVYMMIQYLRPFTLHHIHKIIYLSTVFVHKHWRCLPHMLPMYVGICNILYTSTKCMQTNDSTSFDLGFIRVHTSYTYLHMYMNIQSWGEKVYIHNLLVLFIIFHAY